MCDERLIKILEPAYARCKNFETNCKGYCKWDPSTKYVPSGFGGAKGKLSEVELVIVTAEPAKPIDTADYTGTPTEMVQESMQILEAALKCGGVPRNGKFYSAFHNNLLKIFERIWGKDVAIDTILRKTWFTNSVLCPKKVENTEHSKVVSYTCIRDYLKPQLELFKDAFILVLGKSACTRMKDNGLKFHAYGPHPKNRKNTDWLNKQWEFVANEFDRFKLQGKANFVPKNTDCKFWEFSPCDQASFSNNSLNTYESPDEESEFSDLSIEDANFFRSLRKQSNFDVCRKINRYQIRYNNEHFGGVDCNNMEWYISSRFVKDKILLHLFENSDSPGFKLRDNDSSGHSWWALKDDDAYVYFEKKLVEILDELEKSCENSQ